MKLRLRDYLTISMALLAIFLCGYGVGYLLGEKEGKKAPATISLPAPDEDDPSSWEGLMLDRLNTLLDLTPEQYENVREEVAKTSLQIQESRNDAVRQYYLHLLSLHQRLPEHLTQEQGLKVEEIQESLQQSINLRFPSSDGK